MAVPKFPPPVVGGLERQAHELSRTLVRQGISVTVLSGRTDKTQPDEDWVNGVRVLRLPWSSNVLARAFHTTVVLAWRMICERKHYDVVHIHNVSWFGAFVIIVAKMLGRPVLSKLPNVGSKGIPGMSKRSLGRLWLAVFKWSDAIVAMSEDSAEELRQVRYPVERIFLTSNGVSTEAFRRTGEQPVLRDQRITVIFTGRLSPQKGLKDLLEVWADVLRTADRPLVLELCGTGEQEPELRSLVERNGIGDSVVFRGHVTDVAARLAEADIFVLPSYAEGNSNAVMEAMALGLPIVSTRVGGTTMLVGPVGRPFIVDPGDMHALKHSLFALLDDDARRRVGAAMAERIREYFDIDAVAKRYVQAYALLKEGDRTGIFRLASPVFSEGE